jgi:hypothetical protein
MILIEEIDEAQKMYLDATEKLQGNKIGFKYHSSMPNQV